MIGGGGYSVGVNLQASFTNGDVTVGGGLGLSYGKSGFTGITGPEVRRSLFGGYDDGKFGIGLSVNNFKSGITSQSTGRITTRYNYFSASYENDGTPFDALGLTEGTDEYRTASVTLGYKDITLGMLLFTGHRDFKNNDHKTEEYPYGIVGNPEISKYNAGVLYIGFGNMRAGWNNDWVRHTFQNRLAHGVIKKQPWIPRNHSTNEPYFVYGSNNPYTNC